MNCKNIARRRRCAYSHECWRKFQEALSGLDFCLLFSREILMLITLISTRVVPARFRILARLSHYFPFSNTLLLTAALSTVVPSIPDDMCDR